MSPTIERVFTPVMGPGRPGPSCGPHNPLFLKYLERSREFIETHQLPTVSTTEHTSLLSVYAMESMEVDEMPSGAGAVAAQFRRTVYGGMKLPHLHYGENIYLLNDKQWNEYSGGILAGIKDKINATQKVTFDQLADLTAGTQTL